MKNPLLHDPSWLAEKYLVERLSLDAIAKIAGVPNGNRTTVRRALIRAGIPIRSISEGRSGIPSDRKGIPLSEETKAKLSAARLGKPSKAVWTDEMREALAKRRRGDANPMSGTVSPNRGPHHHPDRAEAQRRAVIRSKTKKFGLTPERYDEMMKAQGGKCAICRLPETKVLYGRVVQLSADHCHSRNVARALLCQRCNIGLGNFRDDPVLMRAAADYIEKYKDVEAVPID